MSWTWTAIKSSCLNSLTVAWAYGLFATGLALENIDTLAAVVNDPTISQQIAAWLHADPKALGTYSMIAGTITAAARARSLAKRR